MIVICTVLVLTAITVGVVVNQSAAQICEHLNLKKIAKASATCEPPGHNEYYQCQDCQQLFMDITHTVVYDRSLESAALGHDYIAIDEVQATCTKDGYITYACSHDCGKNYNVRVPAKGHNADENGICTVCGEEVTDETETSDKRDTVEINGLVYECVYDAYYKVTGSSQFTDSTAVITESIDDLPVTTIDTYAFYNNEYVTTLILPTSIKNISYASLSAKIDTIFYLGTSESWEEVSTPSLSQVTVYYYLAENPDCKEGNYWYYSEYDEPQLWIKE